MRIEASETRFTIYESEAFFEKLCSRARETKTNEKRNEWPCKVSIDRDER